jgi:type IV secretion system protein VirB4
MPLSINTFNEGKNKIEAAINASKKTAGNAQLKSSSAYSEFVPYYCHYNNDTLLTKNGELMQIIKIDTNLKGVNYEGNTDETNIVREAIRRALTGCIKTDNISLWIHTVRKRTPINSRVHFKEPFARNAHDRWQQVNRWKFQYYNEIYISVLFDGQDSTMTDFHNIKNMFFPVRNREYRNAYLEVAHQTLDDTVSEMITSIQNHFQASKLGLVERIPSPDEIRVNQPIFYSQPMEFLGLLLNLRNEEFLLPQMDISESLITTNLTLGFNALETKNSDGKRRFAAILTLKQYREVPSETIDRLLQAPMEFIASQAFYFIPHSGALVQYKEQKELFDISGDEYCLVASGIADMMASQSERPTDFGEHQTSIMVLADEFKQLDNEIIKVQEAFADLGLITIREDVKLEECFWSQLPGNFTFIRRKDIINTSRVGGFCRLNRFPNGNASNNHWGEAATILPTLVHSPYFFNFHHQDNGHTAIVDFNSFNDNIGKILTNFLLSECRKYDGKLFVFDRNRSADLLFKKLGGDYHNFPTLERGSEHRPLQLNPFSLTDSKLNRSFLIAWMVQLVSPTVPLPDVQKEILRNALDTLYSREASQRHLGALIALVSTQSEPLATAFTKWSGEGTYAGIFDATEEKLNLQNILHAFDMTPVVKAKDSIIPIFSYLLHRIITSVDGRPTMIVLHEALDLLDNEFMAPRLESVMNMLQENNAILIFSSTKPSHFSRSPLKEIILKNCATHLFLPGDIKHNYATSELGISTYEADQMLRMERQKGDFLLKQNHEAIALRANLKEMDEYYAIFANDAKTLSAAMGKFNSSKAEDR